MIKSFYELDYVIELSERRLEQYNADYQKILTRFTNIILLYSIVSIFLIPLCRFFFEKGFSSICFAGSFGLLVFLLLFSIGFTIRLLLPVGIAYLDPPSKYYENYRCQMEHIYPGKKDLVDKALKGAYIVELDNAITVNARVFRRKKAFYYNALVAALLAMVPYLVCLGFYLVSVKGTP